MRFLDSEALKAVALAHKQDDPIAWLERQRPFALTKVQKDRLEAVIERVRDDLDRKKPR